MIERGGVKVKDILGRKNPWAPSTCSRQYCMICSSMDKKEGTPTTCSQEGVCYMISCDQCKAAGVVTRYYGESSRTPYLRGKEHLKGQAKKLEENPLAKHDALHHQDTACSYSMRILRHHKAPLGRQVHESVCSQPGDPALPPAKSKPGKIVFGSSDIQYLPKLDLDIPQ